MIKDKYLDQLRLYYDRSMKQLTNALFTIFGENHLRQVLFIKIAGNTTQPIIINELMNKRLVYFYISPSENISFKTNLWDLLPQTYDFAGTQGIDEIIFGGGFIDSPLGFNLTITSSIKFWFTSTTANDTLIKVVFHSTELVKD